MFRALFPVPVGFMNDLPRLDRRRIQLQQRV